MSDRKTGRPLPALRSDAQAERFVDEAELTDYDLSGFRPGQFEFAKKDQQVNLRMPAPLLDEIKARARRAGMPYQRYIRMVLEQEIQR